MDEIQKRIEEEKRKQKEEEEKDDNSADEDGSNCLGNLGSCSQSLFEINAKSEDDEEPSQEETSSQGSSDGCNFTPMFSYAPFPYAVGWGNNINKLSPGDYFKPGFLEASIEGSYLFENTGNISGRLSGAFLFLHFNGFYRYIFAETKKMNTISLNAGISIPLQMFMIDFYCGGFYLDYIGNTVFSFGGSFRIFLPAKLILSFYNLNAFYYSLGFHILSASLSLALDRFTIGAGYDYNNYAGIVLQGPLIKLSLWL